MANLVPDRPAECQMPVLSSWLEYLNGGYSHSTHSRAGKAPGAADAERKRAHQFAEPEVAVVEVSDGAVY